MSLDGPHRPRRRELLRKWWPPILLIAAALAFTVSFTMLGLGTSVADLWIVTLFLSCIAGGVGGSFTYIRWTEK